MEGLRFYADLFADWVYHLRFFWNYLNSNLYNNLSQYASQPDAFGVTVRAFMKALDAFGLSDSTVLGFVFSCMGTAFGFYFIYSLIKWFMGLIS